MDLILAIVFFISILSFAGCTITTFIHENYWVILFAFISLILCFVSGLAFEFMYSV